MENHPSTWLPSPGWGDAGGGLDAWWEPPGGPEEHRTVLDLQGQRTRSLVNQRAATGRRARKRSGIDAVTLVSNQTR